MKTRVVARYNDKFGFDVYDVQRYADFDFCSDGVKSCWTTPGLFWRSVITMLDLEQAKGAALNLSKSDDARIDRIVAEFGE